MSLWLNFDHYGLRLVLAKSAPYHYLILVGETAQNYKGKAKELGFQPHPVDPQLLVMNVRVRPDGTLAQGIDLERYKKSFPQAFEVDYDPSLHYRVVGKEAKTTESVESAPVAAAISLGFNKLGREVLESNGERWFRDERGTVLYEKDADGASSVFLRAPDEEALIDCAEGIVEKAWRVKSAAVSDLDQFVGRVGWKGSHEAVHSAIYKALLRWLSRRDPKSMREAFINASRLSENLSEVVGGETLPPIGVAVQRALGTEATLRGRKVEVRSNTPEVYATNAFRSSILSLVSDGDPGNIHAVLAAGKMKGTVSSKPSTGEVHALILDTNEKLDSKGRRLDLNEIESALLTRDADGVSIFVLDAPANEDQRVAFEAMKMKLASEYVVEGEAHIDAALLNRDRGKFLLSVGRRLDEVSTDALPPSPVYVSEWSSLWTWTTEVVSQRASMRKVVVSSTTDVTFNAGEGDRNSYQTPYVSASSLGTPRTMVPRNLEGAMRDALSHIVKIYGDVDEFVAKEFFYDKNELGEIFSPEQIDALALYAHAERRGRGFLNGDQTGIGKGRFLAACIRRRIMQGGKAVFLTERETNLSDIWRDIVATRSEDVIRPLIMNADATIINFKTKDVVLHGASPEEMEAAIKSKAIPDNVNLVMGTYSQLNRDIDAPPSPRKKDIDSKSPPKKKDVAAKPRWLRSAVGKDVLAVLDESHNAAGEGNTARNVEAIIGQSGSVVFSSATFASDAKRMAFYARLFPDGISTGELSSMMQKGGEVFQEVVSAMLVKDGVMVRREFDLSKLTVETVVDTTRFERNRAMMDAIAPILGELSTFSKAVEHRIHSLNNARNGRRGAAENNAARYRISRTGFGSPLYTVSRLFVAALKVDIVADDAIKILESGGKPIILVENTMQQLFEELAAMDEAEDGVVVDMKALLNRIVRNMSTVYKVDENNRRFRDNVVTGVEELEVMQARIRRLIEQLPDLSLSVIDDVKDRIEKAGYTIGEITGRTLNLHNGRIMRRNIPNPTEVKNDFNDGVLDAILINVSGATGIDLHASKMFQDQRQRFMLELQPPSDVVRKMQARGRPNRYDQVIEPVIRTYLSGLPVEMRLAAMDNAKLRKLSANTTSNRDTAQLTRNVPDLINPIGDMVCSRYAESRPELMRRLGFNIGDVEKAAETNFELEQQAAVQLVEELRPTLEEKSISSAAVINDSSRTANEILARLIMLPVDLQTRVCDELIAEFNAAVEEMEARGETPLKAKEMEGIVHPNKEAIFDGAEIENPESVFHEPLISLEAALERTAVPMKSTDLAERIEIGELASGRAQPCIDRIKDGIEEILSPYLPEGVASLADAVHRNIKDVITRKERLERFADVLAELRPGKEIVFTVDDAAQSGIVTRIDYPNRGYEHVMGMYGIEFACPKDEKPRSMRLTTLLNDPKFEIKPGLEAENYDQVLKKFDDAVASKLSKIQLLTNNIYKGMRLNVEHRLGSLVVYRDADGVVHRGISLSKRYHSMKSIPVEITSPSMAFDAVVDNGIELNAASALDEKSFSIRKLAEGLIEIRLPYKNSRKYGYIYDDPYLLDMALSGQDEGRKGIVVHMQSREFKDAIHALYGAGAKFWTISTHREWAQEWHNPRDEVAPHAAM